MEDDEIQEFKDFIYQDTWNDIDFAYQILLKIFESDWQLFEDSDKLKLELIDSSITEIREHLRNSKFKTEFPLNVFKDNLPTALKDYCNSFPIYISSDGKYIACDLTVKDLYGSFIINRNKYKLLFSQMQYFTPLVYHLSLCNLFIELKRRKAEILEKPAIDQTIVRPEIVLKETSVEEENSKYSRECQHIFKNPKARRIFEYLHNNLVSKKNPTADYSFIFRRMQKDKYIYEDIKEKAFRDFLLNHFDIELNSKLKPDGYSITELKEKFYSFAIRSAVSW